MAMYKCERCKEKNPHGVALGMCSPCLSELDTLKKGDTVEWLHSKGGWRTAKFVHLRAGFGTAAVESPLGTVLFRKQAQIRVPGGRDVP